MNQCFWDKKLEYLLKTRWSFLNDDYVEFLIKRVWGFDRPINMIDFGCGAGHLGLRFLPLLPEGSSYTGIDSAGELLRQGCELFAPLPYDVEFIQADLYEYEPKEKFDLAVCFAVLMHLKYPKIVLKKMIDCVKQGGKVICMEAHRNAAGVNAFIEGLTPNQMSDPTLLAKLREIDRERIKRDGNIGIKVPVYMRELGLTDINCRISDRTNYLHPDLAENEKQQLFELLQMEHFGTGVEDKDTLISSLVERGLTKEEATRQYEIGQFLGQWFTDNGLDSESVVAPSIMISYGTKPNQKAESSPDRLLKICDPRNL